MDAIPFQYRFRVALHDIDAAGVLFFAHLFRHAHDAYESWLRALGHPLAGMLREQRIALPLVHAEADYHEPLRHGDEIEVRLEPVDVRASRFAVRYRFINGTGTQVASARTVHCCIDPDSGAARTLPDALAVAIASCRVNESATDPVARR